MSEFDAARLAALMADLVGHLTGRPTDLLPFDRVKASLHLNHLVDLGLRDVPLDLIVGTVDRAREFTRAFLPRDDALRSRWEDVRSLAEGTVGFPPIEVYKVGEAYFVIDGHHRVSVARSLGAEVIEARVYELKSPVPLTAADSIDDVLLKSGWAAFLATTGLQVTDPDELRMTVPDGYRRLANHIEVHRYFRGIETGREVSWEEAVRSWYERVFRPVIAAIRDSRVLADFPGRTEADLYLFTAEHLQHLRERYAPKQIDPDVAARHLRWFYTPRRRREPGVRGWWRGRKGRSGEVT